MGNLVSRILTGVAMAAFLLGAGVSAEAAPITGEINIGAAPGGGGVSAAGGTAWATATGLDFQAATGGFYVGFEGVVTTTSGDFNAYGGLGVTVNDFTFNPFPGGGVVPLWSLAGGQFNLDNLSSVVQDATSIELIGTGTFVFAGFDPTPGSFQFTSQTAGGTGPSFSFSATQVAQAVPEPVTVGLLGLGLLGFGVAARRRVRSQA